MIATIRDLCRCSGADPEYHFDNYWGFHCDYYNFVFTFHCECTLFQFGDLIRLLANVLGMLPENLRPDRNVFVHINGSNIDSNSLANLAPATGFISASNYDYASVTHAYSQVYFSNAVILAGDT